MQTIPKRALVTGGAGFIGSYLCEELLLRGFRVYAVDNFSTSTKANISHLLKNKKFKFYKGSILDRALMRRLIRMSDIVYHMAAAVGVKYILDHPITSMLTNLNGTEIVLELASLYKKKVIIASTSEVYGKHVCSPFAESDDRVLGSTNISRWSYAEGKAIDEFISLAYAKEKKVPVTIVRLFNTVGPRQTARYGMVLPRLIEQASLNKPLTVYGDGEQIRSFSYVLDVVRAIINLSLIKKAEGEIFNIGSDHSISIKDLASKIIKITNSKSKIKYIPYDKAYGKRSIDFEDILCRIPDLSKIREVIGYSPRYGIDDIIKNTLEYYQQKGRA
jgi:UDP-glucose 4-epimerase